MAHPALNNDMVDRLKGGGGDRTGRIAGGRGVGQNLNFIRANRKGAGFLGLGGSSQSHVIFLLSFTADLSRFELGSGPRCAPSRVYP